MGGVASSVVDSVLWPPVSFRSFYQVGDIPNLVMLDLPFKQRHTGPSEVPERKIATLYINPCPNARYVILFSHGNAEDISAVTPWMTILARRLKVNIMVWDPEGYGASTGEPSCAGLQDGVTAVMQHLKTLLSPGQQVVVFGRSIGSYPASFIAANDSDVVGTILECPLASAFRVAFGSVGGTLPFDKYSVISNIRTVRTPVLLIHGTADDIVPFQNSKMLEAALHVDAKVNPLFLEGGNHNDLEAKFSQRLVERLIVFIGELDARRKRGEDDLTVKEA